jgi:four helix bundle protein
MFWPFLGMVGNADAKLSRSGCVEEAIELALMAYTETASYPAAERYGLVSQTRRAAVSISCNIAEGQGRSQPGEFLNQLSVARGSLQEFETLCILAHRLKYASREQITTLLAKSDRISRMLTGLRKAVELDRRRKSRSPKRPRSAGGEELR